MAGWAERVFAEERVVEAYRFAAGVVDPAEAEVCAREALEKIWIAGRRRPHLRGRLLEPSLFRVAVVRLALTALESSRRAAATPVDAVAMRAAVGRPGAELMEVLFAGVDRLPRLQGLVMLLTLGGCRPAEISELTGRSGPAVRNALHHARTKLREELV